MEIRLEELLKNNESEWLDFKGEFHDNNVTLLHDIICLANSYVERDRYLVFGVSNDKKIIGIQEDSNRKTNANIQDLLRQSNFNRIPSVCIETITYQTNIKIDILVIKNRPDKPFFLTKDKTFKVKGKDKTIRQGVVYTRLGDTNTPLHESAPEEHIELMWRERFGLGLPPLERVKRLLNQQEEWSSMNDEQQIYHQLFPEFTIRQGERIKEDFREKWTERFSDISAYSFWVELRYFETILHQETFVSCDGQRYQIPLPKIDTSNSESKYYLQKNSIAYKIAKIYKQYGSFDINTGLQIAGIELRD